MNAVVEQFYSGQLNWVTGIMWCAVAFALSVAAGMLSGLKMGGKAIGNDLAAMMGALCGPTAVVPAIFIGLLLLAWLRS
jgi:hypothetical protein